MTNEEAIKFLELEKELTKTLWDSVNHEGGREYFEKSLEVINMAIKALEIELLTDTEQRIFLTAIRREREVCRDIDDRYKDNDSWESLARVCNSIERKVKKIWE